MIKVPEEGFIFKLESYIVFFFLVSFRHLGKKHA